MLPTLRIVSLTDVVQMNATSVLFLSDRANTTEIQRFNTGLIEHVHNIIFPQKMRETLFSVDITQKVPMFPNRWFFWKY